MFDRFLRELRRRRVPHVATFYLATAWILFEVADSVFPRLGLPDWTVTLVLALLLLAFPLVVGLAWLYDFTPDGVRRTESAPSPRPASADASGPGTRGRAGSERPGRMVERIAVVGAIAVLAVAGAAFLILDRTPQPVNDDALAVLPFRVAGAPALSVLREGMVDLLATKLTGEAGPRAIDSRTTLSRYDAMAGGRELSLESALDLARSLGAGRLLLGEAVEAGAGLTLTATVYDATGTAEARAAVTGRADSLTALVDRLAAKLLAVESGEDSHRLATLTTTSLPALRSYLAGQRAYRSGDFRQAVDRFAEAVQLDSTFALAAMSMALASGWTGFEETPQGLRLAWQHRDRLSERDRALLVALAGPRYPSSSAPIEAVEAAEAAVKLAPWDPHARYLLGDAFFHNGEAAGYPDALERAWEAFTAVLAIDSTFAPALAHYPLIAAMRRDTAALHRARRLRRAAGQQELPEDRWLRAVGSGDVVARRQAAPALDSLLDNSLTMLAEVGAAAGFPLDDLRRAMDAFVSGPTAVDERDFVLQVWMGLEVEAGRYSALPDLARRLSPDAAELGTLMVAWGALFSDGDPAAGHAALEKLQRMTAGPPTDPDRIFWKGTSACFSTYERVQHGDTAGVATVADAFAERDERFCSQLLRATLAVTDDRPDALAQVQRLDSVALRVPGAPRGFRPVLNLLAARLYDALGQHAAALSTVRRVDAWSGFGALAPAWLLRARLAREAGETDEAITCFRKYLDLRSQVDPGSPAAANADAARGELASLVAET